MRQNAHTYKVEEECEGKGEFNLETDEARMISLHGGNLL